MMARDGLARRSLINCLVLRYPEPVCIISMHC